MQYFKPSDPFFVGDCMPFFHQGEFRLYYLLDENHHQSLGGLGGHQWAHASSTDLVNWDHHPLAIPITHDWGGSICTRSVFHHQGTLRLLCHPHAGPETAPEFSHQYGWN